MNALRELSLSIKKYFSKKTTASERVQSTIVAIIWFLFFTYTLTLLYMYAFVLINSFKDNWDFTTNLFGLPSSPLLDNYKNALINLRVKLYYTTPPKTFYIEDLLLNSGIYIAISATVATLTPCVVAYAASRFDFKFNKFLDAAVVIAMVLPVVNSTPSELTILRSMNIYDTYLAMPWLRLTFLGTNYLFFKAGFKGLSNSYSEAAQLDGANYFTIMVKVEIPMISNILLIIFILQAMGFWADWQIPYVFYPTKPTIAYALYNLQFTDEPALTFEGLKLAATILSSIPTLILFVAFRKKMMGGLSFSGLK